MGLVWACIMGLVAGAIARFIFPGQQQMSWLKTMLLGVGGALLAGLLGRVLGWYEPGQGAGLVASVLGALLIIFIVGKLPSKVQP
jgi:uncharacterized membrane protein YeaQ/YmgE (transglycosylase-associated protein family)